MSAERETALGALAALGALRDVARHADDDTTVGAVDAVVHALVYVGDQIAAACERPVALQLVLPNAEAVAAWRAFDREEGGS